VTDPLHLKKLFWWQVVSVEELSDVVEHRLGCSPNFKYFYDPETKAYQGRPHQYNCTYYSALGGNARHYLLARAIQFFTPGIPMVYYVGLFAGLNDYDVSVTDFTYYIVKNL
jgi:sucrose phosphorylase